MKTGYFSGSHSKNNVTAFLDVHAKNQPDKIAFYFLSHGATVHNKLEYGDFNERVSRVAGALSALGIEKGDRVVVVAPISPELYITLGGLQRMGAVPVLLDSLSRKDQLLGIMQNAQPVGIIAPHSILEMFKEMLSSSGVRSVISLDGGAVDTYTQWHTLLEGKEHRIVPVEQSDTALITYTTGSSGTPKGVNRTHRFLSAQHHALKRLFPYSKDAIDLPVFPVFAINNIASGITTVIPAIDISRPSSRDPEMLVSQIKACGVNCMTLAPSSFRNLALFCEKNGESLDSITRVLTGGAPIGESDISRFIRIAPHSKNWILYGSTEVEPITIIESREMLATHPSREGNITEVGVNVGKVDSELSYRCISIEQDAAEGQIDIATIEVGQGEVGELVVSGEHVCEGYYNNPDAFTRTKIRDVEGNVWHRTGDLARVDDEGYVWIVGRKHNVIKHNGSYYFPVRPEIILKDIPHVANAAYVGIDRNNNTRVIAAVTLDSEDETIKDACSHEIEKRFNRENLPLDEVVFMADIPMDVRHHSKVDYRALRPLLEERYE